MNERKMKATLAFDDTVVIISVIGGYGIYEKVIRYDLQYDRISEYETRDVKLDLAEFEEALTIMQHERYKYGQRISKPRVR